MSEQFYIPDLLKDWQWRGRLINPHYQEVKEVSESWTRSFGAFSPKAQHAFDRCDFNLLASLAFPLHDKARLRTTCDLINTLSVFDEHTDFAHEDDVQIMANNFVDAVRNPHTARPKDEWVGGEIARQFWELAVETASPQSQKHFIEALCQYTQSIVEQAADRSREHIRDVQDYLEVRIWSAAIKPCFVLLELDMNLPDEVYHHPVVEELTNLAAQMIMLSNDITSYNLEQARGDDTHNIVTIIMHNHKTDIKGSMDWVIKYHKELEERFMDLYENKIPKFGEPIDAEVAQYVDGLGRWVRGNDYWEFESERYFGTKGLEIQQTRWVALMPKGRSEDVGPQLVDESL
ncbi:terpenoid synthase [Gloeopeniophorella convolvens]|nr:terpenoid synthase [Gloeopeniophorella convolvens]